MRDNYFPEYQFRYQFRHDLRHALKRAEPAIFDDAMRFLEDHPRWMGSGYIREDIWKYIRRYPLTAQDIARLETIALRYLEQIMAREFKYMCQSMTRLATMSFWERVKAQLYSAQLITRLNARCLYAYSAGETIGEKQRLEMHRFGWHYGFRDPIAPSPDERLEAAVHAAENWGRKGVVHRTVNSDDLPIVYYDPLRDMKYATLDMRACNHENMLRALDGILQIGILDWQTKTAWGYAVYLLRQMDDLQAVLILIDFLKTKLVYRQYEGSYVKDSLRLVTIKTLKHYATPEAQAVLAQYHAKDLEWIRYYAGNRHGWALSYP